MNFNPLEMMKNLQNMQKNMKEMQGKMEGITVEGVSGGDMVKIKMNGNMKIVDLTLDPLCVDSRDIQMLQDLIIAAHNDAQSKIKETLSAEVSRTGLDPNMFNQG